jgi:hypothetical protein
MFVVFLFACAKIPVYLRFAGVSRLVNAYRLFQQRYLTVRLMDKFAVDLGAYRHFY